MKRTYLILILLGIVVLSMSNIYLWKDRQQMWYQFNLHLMLEKSTAI